MCLQELGKKLHVYGQKSELSAPTGFWYGVIVHHLDAQVMCYFNNNLFYQTHSPDSSFSRSVLTHLCSAPAGKALIPP